MCGGDCPSQEVIFFAQITCIFIVVISSIVNLALSTGRTEFWAGTMSACLGYIMPSPAISFKKKIDFEEDTIPSLIYKRSRSTKKEKNLPPSSTSTL
jgi:hypothetical protein